MKQRAALIVTLLATLSAPAAFLPPAWAEERAVLTHDAVSAMIESPYQLGELLSRDGIWSIVNLDGKDAGYVFQTAPLAPITGFSSAPIDMLVALTTEGRFIDVELPNHNESTFASGLGPRDGAAARLSEPVSRPVDRRRDYGRRALWRGAQGADMVVLNGVTNATAELPPILWTGVRVI
jgi:NosR/NirI family nitrous oxide reductase transcriptional regulator